MARAVVVIRDEPHYRREAFVAGLKKIGMTVSFFDIADPAPGDVLVIWNRYGENHRRATLWEKRGAKVIVAENGYIGKDAGGLQRYALALSGHNGSGKWHVGGPERFDALGIELKPWRTEGRHILVCGQRGIGSPTMASPMNWHQNAAARLVKHTKRPIKVRAHPGNSAPKTLLSDDLRDAWACVVWSSASGVQALVSGIPVFYDAPHWICEIAALPFTASLASAVFHPNGESPLMDDADRLAALHDLAWAQWTLDEITSGEPFRLLMELP